jgi:DNA replication protein DnaC
MRTPRLLDDLAVSRGDGRYQRLLGQLQRVALLVLDDFLLTPATVEQGRDLLEVVEDRAQLRSTLVASQLPVDAWHGAMADPTLAEAILDRLVHQAHRIPLTGGSLRRRDPEEEATAAPKSPGRSRAT